MNRLVLILLMVPSCTRDWDRFDASVCRWDDPGTFTFETPRPVTGVNSSGVDRDPFLSADRLTLFFSSDGGGGQLRSFRATRARPDDTFGQPAEQSEINAPVPVSRFVMSQDGLTAYITAPSTFPATTSSQQSDLFFATRASTAVPFSSAQFTAVLSLRTAANEWDPFPSPDGLRLYYSEHIPSLSVIHPMVATRDRPGDPWRKEGSKGQEGQVPGLSITPPTDADSPAVTADDLLIVFSSDLPGSIGSRDLWYAVRSARDQPFGTPRQVPGVNTRDLESEVYVTPDGCQLYFARSVGSAPLDLYTARHQAR